MPGHRNGPRARHFAGAPPNAADQREADTKARRYAAVARPIDFTDIDIEEGLVIIGGRSVLDIDPVAVRMTLPEFVRIVSAAFGAGAVLLGCPAPRATAPPVAAAASDASGDSVQ